jgi:hypothetical protein
MPKRLPLSRRAIRALSLTQLEELSGFVGRLIRDAKENEKRRASTKREVVEEASRDNKTYRLVAIRCGKENCKCAKGGGGHGPYWYAFWSEEGTTRCEYVGKKLPRGVERNGSRE